MGITNTKHQLSSRYAIIAGEILKLRSKIESAERHYRVIPAMQATIEERKTELGHLAAVLKNIDPNWDTSLIQPRTKHRHRSPVPRGKGVIWAMDIIRHPRRWVTIREVVLRIMAEHDIENTPDNYQLITANIGKGFNLRLERGELEIDRDSWPMRWRVALRSTL
jgi:hypothetical protein